MLTLLRNMLRSKLALLLIGLLIVSMAVWGVTDVFSGGAGSSLAKVGDRRIEVADVNRAAERIVNAERANGNIISRQDLADNGGLDQIMNLLLNQETTTEFLEDNGLRASTAAGGRLVRDFEVFQNAVTGDFDRENYRSWLGRNGYTERQFSNQIRDDLTRDYAQAALPSGLKAPDSILGLKARFDAETRRVAFFQITPEDLTDAPPAPTDEDIQTFYNESSVALTSPERRSVSVISLSAEDFFHKIDVSNEEIELEYNAQSRRFTGPATRTFDEIIFPTPAVASEAATRLAVGDDILAVSDELGALTRTTQALKRAQITDQAYAEALFTAPPSAWMGPVQVGSSYNVYRVTEETPGEAIPLELVESEIRQEILNAEAENLLYDAIEDIEDAIGSGATLEEMSQNLGAPVMHYPPVDISGRTETGDIVRNLVVLEDALPYVFDLFEGEVSDRRESEETQYIIRLNEIVPSAVPPLEEVRDDLRVALERQNIDNAMQEMAEAIAARIREKTSFIDLEAEALGREALRPEQALRRVATPDSPLPQGALTQVFSTPLDAPIVGQLVNGRVIMVVEAIDIPSAESVQFLLNTVRSEVEGEIEQDFANAFLTIANEAVTSETNSAQFRAYVEENQSPR